MILPPYLLPSPASQASGRKSRLLFHWRASDLRTTPLTGQAPTFSRASAGGAVADSAGVMGMPVYGQPRFDVSAIGADVGLLMEYARTNLVTQSENFGAWTTFGTPTLLSGQSDPFGGTGAYLVTDDDPAAVEGFYWAVTFTGDGTKAVSIFAKSSTAASSVIRLHDITASAARLLAVITWASTPSVACTAGAFIRQRQGVNGWWRFDFQATGVVAANTNRVYAYPAETSYIAGTSTGGTYFYGAQAEDAAYPSSYIRTAGTTVTRTADRLTYPCNVGPLTPATDDFTLYARFARPNHVDVSGNIVDFPGILSIGVTSPDLRVLFSAGSRVISFAVRDGSGNTTSAPGAAVPSGATIEVCAQAKDLTVLPALAIDTGAGLSAFATGAAAPFTAFTGGIIGLSEVNGGAHHLGAPLLSAKVAAGLLTLDQMRQAF